MTKSSLRNYQDRMANTGWRIRLIPFDDSSKQMRIQTNWLGLIGAGIFVGGIGFYFHTKDFRFIYMALGGWVFGMAGVLLVAKFKRHKWVKTEALCVDREVQKGFKGKSTFWAFRLLCKFAYEGENYSTTPAFWKDFGSEQAINDFLGKKIHQDGKCFLYVNPKNPLQTDFAAEDITDKLIH